MIRAAVSGKYCTMNHVLVFQHIDCEGPAYLGSFLDAREIPYRVIRIDQGERVPDATDAPALVFMGGPMSVNDDIPWIAEELALIRRAHVGGVPLLGHCLGAQLISRALGGTVGPNTVTEIGWFPVNRADNPAAAEWLDGLADEFEVFHMHGETFSLPEGASLLVQNAYCTNQGFVMGSTLALQFHVEVTADLLREWVGYYAEDIKNPSESVQSAADILADCDRRAHNLHQLADHLYTRWTAYFTAQV